MDISAYEGRDELRNYISDLSDFKLIAEYVEKKANPDDKLFLFNVTMQNHGDNDSPANFDQEVWLTGDMEGKYPEADIP
ncbi:MAG: LTA synthase family protein, partial [Pilosibacter sp.]